MSELAKQGPAMIARPAREATKMAEQSYAPQSYAQSRSFLRALANPWADKALAILAVLPFVYPIVTHFQHQFRLGEFIYLGQVLLLIGTMVFRRLPVRISSNLYYWVVAFLASYWGLFLLSVEQPGRRLVTSPWILFTLYLLGVFMDVWGRVSLGRNIAMLPAQRQIVERGAYRRVRHPIYTASFLILLGGALGAYTLQNLVLYVLGAFWFVARSLAEEDFLRKDPAYEAYMKRVPSRWFPGLI